MTREDALTILGALELPMTARAETLNIHTIILLAEKVTCFLAPEKGNA